MLINSWCHILFNHHIPWTYADPDMQTHLNTHTHRHTHTHKNKASANSLKQSQPSKMRIPCSLARSPPSLHRALLCGTQEPPLCFPPYWPQSDRDVFREAWPLPEASVTSLLVLRFYFKNNNGGCKHIDEQVLVPPWSSPSSSSSQKR